MLLKLNHMLYITKLLDRKTRGFELGWQNKLATQSSL